MSTASQSRIRHCYLEAIRNAKAYPRNLATLLAASSETLAITPPSIANLIAAALAPGDAWQLRQSFHSLLATLDYASDPDWANDTKPSTGARRALLLEMLGVPQGSTAEINTQLPYAPAVDQPSLIASDIGWEEWYTPERASSSTFYWESHEKHLLTKKRWSPKNVAALGEHATKVLERMCDPFSDAPRATKGLVVGFVQSGKTAHFTCLLAKAVDAGYRLVIILAGVQNALRDQTQRRLDKDLIGTEILGDSSEYGIPKDWDEFISHKGVPSHLGSFDWERLTTAHDDFKHLRGALGALHFRRVNPALRLRSPANLAHEPVRLLVVKKNDTSLSNLTAALKAAGDRVPWRDVPAVVIDDESDQASLNTSLTKRTTINKHITTLLELLGPAQYVGYTATPFANVFVDPEDEKDLFPSDYILPLPRPDGYMGVQDFYDLGDTEYESERDYRSNKNAYVRAVVGPHEKPENLPRAIDAFVLSGAIKLWRRRSGVHAFKHHTMLVHQHSTQASHEKLAGVVQAQFAAANYLGGGEGMARLRGLWKDDYEPVAKARAPSEQVPPSFESLKDDIALCVMSIQQDHKPVLVLNGENKDDTPDFDAEPVWKIIVGGAKLSRGYTVEGLTVSYYRRSAGAADTLMQMGRWFGYREGYRDLVRLFIGTAEPLGKKGGKTINLYQTFLGACRDEEGFRSQLVRYARTPGNRIVTPREVPPLVPSHMLRPTAPGKMRNAKLTYRNFGGEQVQKVGAPVEKNGAEHNLKIMKQLLISSGPQKQSVRWQSGERKYDVPAIVGVGTSKALMQFVDKYEWVKPSYKADIVLLKEFLNGEEGDPEIERWLLLAPLLKGQTARDAVAVGDFTIPVRERSRTGDGQAYAVYSESQHVSTAEWLSGVVDGSTSDAATAALVRPRTAVCLLYLVRDYDRQEKFTSVGWVLQLPSNGIQVPIKFSVKKPALKDAVVSS